MKHTSVITASELQNAALHVMLQRKAFVGKHVAAFEFDWNPNNENKNLRLIARVILFDTEGAAARYLAGDDNPKEDEKVTQVPDDAATSGEDGAADPTLEGTKHG